ncbi:uncharacterized protein KY384_002539 [Bacidia gigantensis]|uniref:uncharacterized protein n=1 Tax=Bacidia gigantensis TaxID=2732470 RepID=UPI001D0567C0|nr:uncharacterized protein KY384_002539 [Bacidia gigantensis]KAG8532662.1 hypothetical protein KY384_002539 [Bacidia gigantensis]
MIRGWTLRKDVSLCKGIKNRYFASISPAVTTIQHRAFAPTSGQKRVDDETLRKVFDSRLFWNEFGQTSKNIKSSKGLFQNRYLIRPTGFHSFARDIQEKCRDIVDDVLRASSTEEYNALPRKLDLLSDCLCRVLDLADFVRNTHPNTEWQRSAANAHAHLWEYMNILNTTPGLHSQLKKAYAFHDTNLSWNEEETCVARNLLKDFSQSAIDLPAKDRQRFIDLSNRSKYLGIQFTQNMMPQEPYVRFRKEAGEGLDPVILRRYTSRMGNVSLPLTNDILYVALGSIHSEQIRKTIYTNMKTVAQPQLDVLSELLKTRTELASLSKFKGYAEMTLVDKMAKTPEAVNSFLAALSSDNAPGVAKELRALMAKKSSDGTTSSLQPWDILYYENRIRDDLDQKQNEADNFSAYFSLGTVIQGLSRLFDRLYGIRLVPRETESGETWYNDVRRLDVVNEGGNQIAVLYCDLFERDGKTSNPAHFTLRCSREISEEEAAASTPLKDDGMARATSSSSGKLFQLPTIALICNYAQALHPEKPTLLSFRDVQTLFHEMGHALHSIMGRTSLHIVSGTRCATDFAELPSVLMESFASDESVLGLFARHWKTDAPLPFYLIRDLLERRSREQGLSTESQILYSLLDQAYHSSLPANQDFDTTKTFYDIYDRYGSIREPRDISPQGFLGHFVEYSGTYYSYLFDRAIAGKIWREVFQGGQNGGAINREAGEKYKNEVLRWGGSRDPWACVSGVLGDERLKYGGKEAMELVGQWGVKDYPSY